MSATTNLVQEKVEPVLQAVEDKAEDLIDVVTSGTQTPVKGGGSSAGGSGKVSMGFELGVMGGADDDSVWPVFGRARQLRARRRAREDESVRVEVPKSARSGTALSSSGNVEYGDWIIMPLKWLDWGIECRY